MPCCRKTGFTAASRVEPVAAAITTSTSLPTNRSFLIQPSDFRARCQLSLCQIAITQVSSPALARFGNSIQRTRTLISTSTGLGLPPLTNPVTSTPSSSGIPRLRKTAILHSLCTSAECSHRPSAQPECASTPWVKYGHPNRSSLALHSPAHLLASQQSRKFSWICTYSLGAGRRRLTCSGDPSKEP